jgi:uncharacterized protein (DUF302 family)
MSTVDVEEEEGPMDTQTRRAEPEYGFTARFPGMTLSRARERITEALQAEGFGVLTEIDVQATLKKKIGADFRPYLILGACNPRLAARALDADPGVGLLLPCNVCLWQEDDAAVVSIARPDAMFAIVRSPALQPIVDEATDRLRSALARMEQA